MKSAMDILQPELARGDQQASSLGKVVIGTIEGDIHDIGKNLVAAMLSANGFDVTDLGADVKLERFISSAREEGADLICVSALLTTTMLKQKTLVSDLKSSGLLGQVKIMVGGAPVNRRWADEIGAHGYGSDAMSAVEAAKKLVEAR
jgi:trimethylamine corrinoid protein